MADVRCALTELLKEQCAHCIEIERGYPYDNIDRVEVGAVIQALYAGNCVQCGTRYAPGMTIGHTDDGWVLMACCGEKP